MAASPANRSSRTRGRWNGSWPATIGRGRKASRKSLRARCRRWPRVASTTRSAGAFIGTRRIRVGSSRISRRCCTTTRASWRTTCTRGSSPATRCTARPPKGSSHGPKKNVLFVDQEPEAIAKSIGLSSDRVRDLIASGKRKLKIARDKRPMPGVDHTIFATWNGMMITAVLEAAMAFDRKDVRMFALKSLQRVLSEMWSKDRGMWHALADGERKVRGLLDSQVYVVDALLSAYSATGDPAHLRSAEEIMVFTLDHFR